MPAQPLVASGSDGVATYTTSARGDAERLGGSFHHGFAVSVGVRVRVF